jgi:hypothetical protein
MGFGLVFGDIEHLLVITTSNCNAITNSHTLQFTTACIKSFQFSKVCVSLISHPLTYICKHSLLTGICICNHNINTRTKSDLITHCLICQFIRREHTGTFLKLLMRSRLSASR